MGQNRPAIQKCEEFCPAETEPKSPQRVITQNIAVIEKSEPFLTVHNSALLPYFESIGDDK
ncbi:MAG: hypothetical protein C4324_02320 [Blastocatellia bacterium]